MVSNNYRGSHYYIGHNKVYKKITDMKIAVIADIHGHLVSLKKCLASIRDSGINNIICLGDIFNGDQEINDRITFLFKEYNIRSVLGNHDMFRLGDAGLKSWEDMPISEESYNFFKDLPLRVKYKELLFTHICPTFDKIRLSSEDLADLTLSIDFLKKSVFKVCFIGHTHKEFIMDDSGKKIIPELGNVIELDKTRRYIINPGAVDITKPIHDQRICYGVFDYSKWCYTAIDALHG
jgi:predicted phosphodiesterase